MSLWKKFPREYASWKMMKNRCDNENYKQFKDYGGRGINYSPSWSSFVNFFNDMGVRPENTSLDRRDNDKGYSKENCKWATRSQQSLNKRVYSRKVSSLAGVRVRPNKTFSAQITIDGRKVSLGTFKTEQEAHERFVQERCKRSYFPTQINKDAQKNS